MLVRGESFSGFMRTGRDDDYATIWIDENDNDVFEDSERILDNLKIGTTKKLYSIYIPVTMDLGTHRLRVRIIYSALLPQTITHSCNNYIAGETEDYLVNITSTASTRNVAPGIPGSCMDGSETTIGPTSNNNGIQPVTLLDSSNRCIAGIYPNGANMGTVKASFYRHNGPVRITIPSLSIYYLDRNLTLDIENGFSGPWNLRIYFLTSELNALIAEPGSGVSSIFDLNATSTVFNVCSSTFLGGAQTNLSPTGFGSLSGDSFLDFTALLSNPRSFFLHAFPVPLRCGSSMDDIYCVPTITTSVSQLNPFFNCNGIGVSPDQAFTINYFNDFVLSTSISVNVSAPPGFEVSTTAGNGYGNSLSFPVGAGQEGNQIIFVRRNNVPGTPWGNITCSVTTSPYTQKVFVSSTANASAADLAGVAGGPGISQTVTIAGAGVLFTEPSFPCKIISYLFPSGASPFSGNTTAKVWVENNVPLFGSFPYVARHFDIQAASGSTGNVTLYFKQTEFDAFNAHAASVLDLPTGPADAAGIANLRVYRYPGTSSDGSGLPYTYSGTPELINPADAEVVWNAAAGFWQVSFDVSGTGGPGGFIVGTANTLNLCPLGSFKIPAGATGSSYQWQVDNGSGFININNNGGNYNGVFTPTLTLTTLPTSFYGYKYRCLVNGTPSTVYDVKFLQYWLGTSSTTWASLPNWAPCNDVPDQYTDVVIPSGRTNYPVLSANNTTIRSLRNDSGSSLNVQAGKTLTITGQ